MTDSMAPIPASPSARPEVLNTVPGHHGALDYAELERLNLDAGSVIDFSVNSNPYGPSPRVREALAEVQLDRYPDREALALRRALAARLDLAPECIVVGNGAAEILLLLAMAFLRQSPAGGSGEGDRVVVVEPTFGEYARVAAMMGATVHSWTAREEAGFAVAEEKVRQLLQRVQPRLAFVCNPNNPTGIVLPPEALAGWAASSPATLLVVDESYHAFAPGFRSALSLHMDNVLVVRSMTKDYALAGLRLGYAAGALPVIEAIRCVRPAWNVNALAQAAGLAALADHEHLCGNLEALREAKEALVAGLGDLGWAPMISTVHYFLMHVGDGAALRQALLRRGMLVRDCASFGLPEHVRIATRRPEENARLLAVLRKEGPWARP